jgi:hypothetical protein
MGLERTKHSMFERVPRNGSLVGADRFALVAG